jgi:hypothetical protein
MLDFPEELGPRQRTMLVQGMNDGFTGIIIGAANGGHTVRRCLLKFAP